MIIAIGLSSFLKEDAEGSFPKRVCHFCQWSICGGYSERSKSEIDFYFEGCGFELIIQLKPDKESKRTFKNMSAIFCGQQRKASLLTTKDC
jgi:hypothetical protein